MGKWRKPLGREKRWNKATLIKRDGLLCAICGLAMKTMKEVTIDHIVPQSKGGLDELENLRLAHPWCNNERGDAMPEDDDG